MKHATATMNRRRLARRLPQILMPTMLVALLLGTGALASPTNEIEGVWSFGGGAVAIQSVSGGMLQGTVVNPTKFATCVHPAGQVMWEDITPQPDGSFWGKHVWYHNNCEVDPQRGLTAWRVLSTAEGGRSLEVCFSAPGSPSQPKIAANGKTSDDTYGCVQSTPLAPASATESSKSIALPNSTTSGTTTNACVKLNQLKLALRDPRYDPLERVIVTLQGKRVLDVRGIKRIKRGIILKHLPTGTYKIEVTAVTVLKQRLSGSNTYHSCGSNSGTVKLHHIKRRHPKHHRDKR